LKKNPKPSTSFLQNAKPPYIYNLWKKLALIFTTHNNPRVHDLLIPKREPKIKKTQVTGASQESSIPAEKAIRNRYNSKVRK
jgi:hypothetical protein